MTLFWNSDSSAPFWGAPSSLFWQTDSTAYSYDALGRLTGVTYANGTTIIFSYDANGNRVSVVTTCGPDGC
jgi:YD repeat-containing protein